jgi:hypothetical protein
MSTYTISCTIGTTDSTAPLGLEVWLDDVRLFDTNHVVYDNLPLTFGLDDDEAEHELRFVMTGKTQEHTQLDTAGNIIKDAQLCISNLAFDEIELKQVFTEHAVYTHNFNGTQETIDDKFYGIMGCNGTVSLRFTTPIYLWLLESM